MLKKVLAGFFTVQFIRFLLVGGTAAFVNFLSRFFFRHFFSYDVSVALAFMLGAVISFALNKTFTFRAYDESVKIQALKFITAGIIGAVLGSVLAVLVLKVYQYAKISFSAEKQIESIAHLTAIGLCACYDFLVMKYFAFRKVKGI